MHISYHWQYIHSSYKINQQGKSSENYMDTLVLNFFFQEAVHKLLAIPSMKCCSLQVYFRIALKVYIAG